MGIERYSRERYGLEPTTEAFKVRRRTLYYWRSQLREGNESNIHRYDYAGDELRQASS